ncbi:RtcB family protein [Desulfurivibrio dismutans]|uniref:RtcB family protein n=1 Tax=Desulfurivibrio dismutans TaxID=1398908 RepID=UPI0023DA5312|nr:RtcB family protein [Desulfurivibrio alkaliphilus]MDF1614806.1 RtcB family protein [Desulfurivibrio alkaliphilus]
MPVKKVITSEKQPIKVWLDNLEAGALEQAKNLANLPFIHRHVALMPDTHLGYGMPIGGVIATTEMVIPNAVGVDIGCGMGAVQTSLSEISSDKLKQALALIRQKIPLGFKHHRQPQDKKLMPKSPVPVSDLPVISEEFRNALYQLGTLGGGNHFIEIQRGSDGHIWLMVHSGSRNLGFKVANYFNRLAAQLNREQKSKVPANWQLAYLPVDSPAGRNYLLAMQYCVDFAYANRDLMLTRIKETLQEVLGPVTFAPMINIAHNYAALEEHYGQKVIVHRKGATRALAGEIGIIPGSQGTPSYLVRGLGNPESFRSCSHGAGRKMGRKQAQRQLSLEEEKRRLDRQGIIHAVRSKGDLDEAAGAYKEIDQVIENQLDLVEVLVEMHPMAVIKG